MKYEILINSILRVPIEKALILFKEYEKNVGFKSFAEQQRALDILTHKVNNKKGIKREAFSELRILLLLMVRNKSAKGKITTEDIKGFPFIVWIEVIGFLEPEEIMSLLENYCSLFSSLIIETCIINLPENMQLTAIDKYNKYIDPNEDLFSNFYYSVSEKSRLKLKEYFSGNISDDILLELSDIKKDAELIERLEKDKERLLKQNSDDLLEFILLRARHYEILEKFLKLFGEKINECSTLKFKLLFTRYKYLKNNRGLSFFDEEDEELLSDLELFKLFKNKFHEMGIEETLSLFNNITHYKSNKFTSLVVSEFLDLAYSDIDISKYINEETIEEIIKNFAAKCSNKNYTLEDLEILVNSIKKDGKTKLIFDNYIEAIIACGKLLKDNIITDKHPLFLTLRNKFTEDLISRSQKDGTYLESISLNGVFYRLAKGSMPFEKVYMTKTYKGLIYLSKCGKLVDNADYITNFLTDEQLAKLNISPIIKWKNEINRTNTDQDNLSFIERMGLQLLCYFGPNKARYLLESDMRGNRMENLFDGLKYEEISISEDSTPNINEDLINYLFGRGIIKENNSVINRMIRGEIPEFEKYFTEFCNSFNDVKTSCNGILSVRRILKHFSDIDLPIELKPDEKKFIPALNEMNTKDESLLKQAIELCKDARNRSYSSIPKVEGKLGDFTYKILDLNDPMAVAVGYLSHCCFVVEGISYSALKHSMQSTNGRTFVVYYKGQFLTQSWVWRNGDVICFDSVEAGSPYHGMYRDDIKLVDVYKKAAGEMLHISQTIEDDIQRVKAVTIGKSDYTFNNLERLNGDVPRPLEKGVYVYDSSTQHILAGSMPKNPRYGVVGAQYKDPRKKVVFINDVSKADIDTLDDISLDINSIRYQAYYDEEPIDFKDYYKVILGDEWYILFNNDGSIDGCVLNRNEDSKEEFKKYFDMYKDDDIINNGENFVKQLKH